MSKTETKLEPVTADMRWWELPVGELTYLGFPIVSVYRHPDELDGPQSAIVYQRGNVIEAIVVGDCSTNIFRRVLTPAPEVEGWRYFKDNYNLFRVKPTGSDQKMVDGCWIASVSPWTLRKFLDCGWLETDANGNPLPVAAEAKSDQFHAPKSDLARVIYTVIRELASKQPDLFLGVNLNQALRSVDSLVSADATKKAQVQP